MPAPVENREGFGPESCTSEVQPAKEPTESAGRRAPVVKPGNPREPELSLEVAGGFRGQVKRENVFESDFQNKNEL